MKIKLEDVQLRLAMLGVSVEDTDTPALNWCIKKVTNRILNDINQPSIPKGLMEIAVDMVCAEFLLTKRATGQPIGGIIDNAEAAVKTLNVGKTSITFADSSASSLEDSFNDLITYLLHKENYSVDMAHYRRIQW